MVYNQFVPGQMKHPVSHLNVGYWALTPQELYNSSQISNFDFYGDFKKYGTIEFYFPLDLSDEYPELVKSLGPPKEVLEGILNPSGRSIWLLPKKSNPLCLKIDTMQLTDRKFFSERVLLVGGVMHSVSATEYLKDDKFNCSEDRGGNMFFKFKYNDGNAKRYTYLLREYDFKKLNILKNDYLVPIVALLSVEFWSNKKLLQSMGVDRTVTDFIQNDFAKCFADLIKNSLTKTFLHFEVHQQNLSIHIRKGIGIKLVYHDLQDTVFDTVTYLLKKCDQEETNNISEHYNFIDKFQKNFVLNAHGHLLKHTRATREYFTVVSIYRRYLRNFGAYNKSLNYFLNSENNTGQYFYDKIFEKQILKFLEFGDKDLQMEEARFATSEQKNFLKNDLFWTISRFHQVTQRSLLNRFIKKILSSAVAYPELEASLFEQMVKKSTILYSNGFPINIANIEFSLVTKIISFFEDKVLLVTYKSENYLIVRLY